MINTILVGTGAVAAELTSYIQNHNNQAAENDRYNLVGYLEFADRIDKYYDAYGLTLPVLGDVDSYTPKQDDHFIVAMANLDFRLKMIDTLKAKGGRVIGFKHFSSIVDRSVIMGEGNIIYPHCIIGPKAKLGEHNLITSYSCISHDSVIGDNNFFATTVISGHVFVGNHNFFGIRTTVIPNVAIGSYNTIQAGMVVDKNVGDNTTVFYRFKEKVMLLPKVD